jgi:uncharacterized iron-regulated membrane protein
MSAATARPAVALDWDQLDRVVAAVAPLRLADPVLVSPPAVEGDAWTAKSDAQNRTLRSDLTVDGGTGQILSRVDFNQRELVDRIVGVGVAAHEGHLFGWLNQLVSLSTAFGLSAVCVSAIVMWWGRRPAGALGAPQFLRGSAASAAIVAVIVAFALLLPLLGASIVAVLTVEKTLLRRIPAARDWLGLRQAN